MKQVFNFSAGPATLPISVLNQIQSELYNWNNLGISIMEVSHRSDDFIQLAYETKKNLRILLDISDNYEILFCHGGARAQFSAIPMNLFTKLSEKKIDYINTGYWSHCAAIEAQKYCFPNIVDESIKIDNLKKIKLMSQWNISSNSIYLHYCPNETIDGMTIYEEPIFFNKTIVADCSSILLSRPMNINKFGIIYATAQKNIGISGLTIVIINRNLLKQPMCSLTPSVLNYRLLSDNDSLFNTPTTISWYIANLMFKWLKNQGGLKEINKINLKKAEILYNTIDASDFYYNTVDPLNRSCMNVPFFLKNEKLNHLFLQESINFGLYGLKGHRVIGGMRASLYNAMTLEGVEKLIKFMNFFSEKYS